MTGHIPPDDKIGVIVLGASGAGKSTLLRRLHERLSTSRAANFAPRLTTRSRRPDDLPWENQTVSLTELARLQDANDLLLKWTKPIGTKGEEHYAFRSTSLFPVILGGNNALITNASSIVADPGVWPNLVKVGVSCVNRVRIDRLLARDPVLRTFPEEMEARILSDIDLSPVCDVVLDNSDEFDALALSALVDLIMSLSRRHGS